MLVSEYRPKAYKLNKDGEDIDVDDSNDGDYIVCPEHEDAIIYVFGTNFWQKEGGPCSFGWSSLVVRGYCFKCGKHVTIPLGSYGG